MYRRLVQIASFAFAFAVAVPAVADDGRLKFLRIVEEPATRVSLEIATVDMVPAGEQQGPRIGLVGVAHIGDADFYTAVQNVLDAYEIVLFEAVQPLDARRNGDGPDDLDRQTRGRMRFIAAALEAYKQEHENYPASLEQMRAFVGATAPIMSNWLSRAAVDPWGAPLEYERAEDKQSYTLISDGGETTIHFEEQADTTALDLEQDNLQQQLADALSLEFQLRALRYDAPNWRPSDMSVNELNAALARHDVDFSIVGGTLAGTSFPARLVSGLLRLVAVFDAMAQGAVSDMMKVMMIEMLGNESVLEMGMTQLGEGFATVIVDERNQVVVDDLKAILRDEPEVTSIAVLYGAAHMHDFVERLQEQMGYVAEETRWLPAISVDLTTSQMDPMQVRRMRMMVQRIMQQQMAR